MVWLHAVVDVPAELADAEGRFWAETLGWPLGAPWPGHPELCSFEPPRGSPYVHLQRIDGPPRVHLDIECDDPAGVLAGAVERGAELLRRSEEWSTLRSPGGLPFCVLAARHRDPPPPVTWPDAHRSRLVQVCLDAPVAAHDAEVRFWRSLLGGRWVDSPAGEFAGKWHDDDSSPTQLLFQRLEENDGPVRAHLDHGTDDQVAEVGRLLRLGADDVGPGPGGWHVLRDAAGLAFCVTLNSPAWTAHRDLG